MTCILEQNLFYYIQWRHNKFTIIDEKICTICLYELHTGLLKCITRSWGEHICYKEGVWFLYDFRLRLFLFLIVSSGDPSFYHY